MIMSSWNPNGSPARQRSQQHLGEGTGISPFQPIPRQAASNASLSDPSYQQWSESASMTQSQRRSAESQRPEFIRPGTVQPRQLSSTTPLTPSTSRPYRPQVFREAAETQGLPSRSHQAYDLGTPEQVSQSQLRSQPLSTDEASQIPIVPTIVPPPDTNRPFSSDMANHGEDPSLRQPFFVLVKDVHTSEYHHPTVHYVFSDEDTESDLIADAATRSLDETFRPRQKEGRQAERRGGDDDGSERNETATPSRFRGSSPSRSGGREHYIIVDAVPSQGYHQPRSTVSPSPADDNSARDTAMDQSGHSSRRARASSGAADSHSTIRAGRNREDNVPFKVKSAHSLSPTWHVLNSSITPAPTLGSEPSSPVPQEHDNNSALMLQIEGLGIDAFKNDDAYVKPNERQRRAARDQHREEGVEVEELLSRFEMRMGQLKQIVDAGLADEDGERRK